MACREGAGGTGNPQRTLLLAVSKAQAGAVCNTAALQAWDRVGWSMCVCVCTCVFLCCMRWEAGTGLQWSIPEDVQAHDQGSIRWWLYRRPCMAGQDGVGRTGNLQWTLQWTLQWALQWALLLLVVAAAATTSSSSSRALSNRAVVEARHDVLSVCPCVCVCLYCGIQEADRRLR